MNGSLLLDKIKEIKIIEIKEINLLKKQIETLRTEYSKQIDDIKIQCVCHIYDDNVIALSPLRGGFYKCDICDKEIPISQIIQNYTYVNSKIGDISTNKLAENLKQLLDILVRDRNEMVIYSGVYEDIFELQCYKQGFYPVDVFNLLCARGIFEVDRVPRGRVKINR